MTVRQFKLHNGLGQTFDMMRKDAFFHAPDGLGWGLSPTIAPVGETYIVTDVQPERPAPSGEMVFAGYEQYKEFLEFVQVGGLVLGYRPLSVWNYLDVTISVHKSEIAYASKRLICPVDFSGTSQWYEQLAAYQAQESGEGKIYSYRYPYRYANVADGTIDVQNGRLESYPKITIFGPVENPAWALYQSGRRMKTGKVNATIPQGNKLVIDANPSTMEIAEYSANGMYVDDMYADSDFTTDRLFALPPGECRIVLTQDGVGAVKGFVEVRKRV